MQYNAARASYDLHPQNMTGPPVLVAPAMQYSTNFYAPDVQHNAGFSAPAMRSGADFFAPAWEAQSYRPQCLENAGGRSYYDPAQQAIITPVNAPSVPKLFYGFGQEQAMDHGYISVRPPLPSYLVASAAHWHMNGFSEDMQLRPRRRITVAPAFHPPAVAGPSGATALAQTFRLAPATALPSTGSAPASRFEPVMQRQSNLPMHQRIGDPDYKGQTGVFPGTKNSLKNGRSPHTREIKGKKPTKKSPTKTMATTAGVQKPKPPSKGHKKRPKSNEAAAHATPTESENFFDVAGKAATSEKLSHTPPEDDDLFSVIDMDAIGMEFEQMNPQVGVSTPSIEEGTTAQFIHMDIQESVVAPAPVSNTQHSSQEAILEFHIASPGEVAIEHSVQTAVQELDVAPNAVPVLEQHLQVDTQTPFVAPTEEATTTQNLQLDADEPITISPEGVDDDWTAVSGAECDWELVNAPDFLHDPVSDWLEDGSLWLV